MQRFVSSATILLVLGSLCPAPICFDRAPMCPQPRKCYHGLRGRQQSYPSFAAPSRLPVGGYGLRTARPRAATQRKQTHRRLINAGVPRRSGRARGGFNAETQRTRRPEERKVEGRRQKAEGRRVLGGGRRKAEGGRRKAEGGRQKAAKQAGLARLLLSSSSFCLLPSAFCLPLRFLCPVRLCVKASACRARPPAFNIRHSSLLRQP